MADEPPTGTLFRSRLSTGEMVRLLEAGLPEYEWHLGDSDLFRDYYVRGQRSDGVRVRIEPEDDPEEYYLGVYFVAVKPFPDRAWRLETARRIHERVLPLVEGVRRA